jgi:hypothetical protein
MNTRIIDGKFYSNIVTYRSENGQHYFTFDLVDHGDYFDIECTRHPSLNGRDSSVSKTHLYSSGKICFVSGKEPSTLWEAKMRAKEWAEYIIEYAKTGKAQS